ncbi:acyl-CoA desaturase [Xenorhabdus sp. IM139775]|uniref:acyl-CoA desaturase n=1 Tax=Xenorhabdus sp. IM139775 TaxID=3025876 RepID=UPI0023585DB0|nr:acyl-CoA desaturase [Xenorhabdus sp. IM139775]MDC9594324.1 acyl-CoA desaturase [Xenorhabdus sp. IM139775]
MTKIKPPAAEPSEKVQALMDGDTKARRLAYLTVLTPAIGFVAALWYSIQFGFKSQDMVLLFVMYFLTSFGVEGGLHRFFSHRAFKAGPVVTATIGILGCMAAQGPILFWAATHRMHHTFTDQDGDPHSPRVLSPGLRGRIKALWHAHVGWLFTIKRSNWNAYVPDLFDSKLVLFVNRNYLIWVLLGLAIPTAIGAALSGIEGAVGGLLWGGLARIFLLDQITWAVNSIGHTFGNRPNQTRDTSGNVGWLALLSAGGSWHNNHHANPALAHNDLHFWQIDTTAWVIRLLGLFGLVWDIRQLQSTNQKFSNND